MNNTRIIQEEEEKGTEEEREREEERKAQSIQDERGTERKAHHQTEGQSSIYVINKTVWAKGKPQENHRKGAHIGKPRRDDLLYLLDFDC